jgi:MFS family permease
VFLSSFVLTVLDLLYIYFVLPDSKKKKHAHPEPNTADSTNSTHSLMTMDHKFSWNPVETLKIVATDPFLFQVGKVAFLYYTGLWALISTLSLYAVQRFRLTPERLGELISVLGLCTMVAEAGLVRVLVPLLGEKRSIRVGLLSFLLQCVVLGFAYEPWHLFACAAFSLLGNLVYPSLSSLVSGSVEPDAVGEALGAINGIKALTEGIGPIVFGSLMTLSQHSTLPGWPYLLAAVLVAAAYQEAGRLPDPEEDDYVHELERKKRYRKRKSSSAGGIFMRTFASSASASSPQNKTSQRSNVRNRDGSDDEELEGLLSEVDESWDDDDKGVSNNSPSSSSKRGDHDNEIAEDLSRLPKTFASHVQNTTVTTLHAAVSAVSAKANKGGDPTL